MEGGVRHLRLSRRADGGAGRARLPRLLVRGRRLRTQLRSPPPHQAEWEKASTSGQLDGTGHVWEWTASEFAAYPGFRAHPYREYSEPFFGQGHRVLRGGSWATHPRVAGPTFRNWDLPQRRQLFAGLRLARDAP